jgi:hypothetical protein
MEMKYLFVPYEQALELKEIEFDEPCFGWWFADEETLIIEKSNKSTSKNIIQAPTYSQAFRWFRENHNLVYQINYLYNGNYQVVIHKNTHEYMELIQDLEHACVDEIPDNYSYEEAELACLIKLIEIVKTKQNEKRTFNTNE